MAFEDDPLTINPGFNRASPIPTLLHITFWFFGHLCLQETHNDRLSPITLLKHETHLSPNILARHRYDRLGKKRRIHR